MTRGYKEVLLHTPWYDHSTELLLCEGACPTLGSLLAALCCCHCCSSMLRLWLRRRGLCNPATAWGLANARSDTQMISICLSFSDEPAPFYYIRHFALAVRGCAPGRLMLSIFQPRFFTAIT